jgi:hemerythrin
MKTRKPPPNTPRQFKTLEWGPSFELGVEMIDTQHKQLISLLNELGNVRAPHS